MILGTVMKRQPGAGQAHDVTGVASIAEPASASNCLLGDITSRGIALAMWRCTAPGFIHWSRGKALNIAACQAL